MHSLVLYFSATSILQKQMLETRESKQQHLHITKGSHGRTYMSAFWDCGGAQTSSHSQSCTLQIQSFQYRINKIT